MTIEELLNCKYALVANQVGVYLWEIMSVDSDGVAIKEVWVDKPSVWDMNEWKISNASLKRHKLLFKFDEIPKEFLI